MPADKVPETKTGVSQPAVSVARTIDRLPPGDYIIKLEKPSARSESWILEIVDTDLVDAIKQEIKGRSRRA